MSEKTWNNYFSKICFEKDCCEMCNESYECAKAALTELGLVHLLREKK